MRIKLREQSYPGRLFVFEGTDGAGKTTLLTMAHEYLAEKFGGENVLLVKQPTEMSRKTKLFQKMMYCRNSGDVDYRAVQLLTLSDRVQHGYEVIEPALAAGKIVLSDRYVYTSVANMLARGYRSERWFFDAAQHILKPSAVFLAYAEPCLAVERIRSRPEECRRHLDERLLYGVAAEFLELAKDNEFTVLDTAQSAERAFAAVKKRIDEAVAG